MICLRKQEIKFKKMLHMRLIANVTDLWGDYFIVKLVYLKWINVVLCRCNAMRNTHPHTIDWIEQVNKQQDINMGFTV